MKTSAVCPSCGARLGIRCVVTALTPFRITCPGCKAKLDAGIRMRNGMVAAILAAAALAVTATYFITRDRGNIIIYVGFAGLLLVGLAAEVLLALFVLNKASFTIRRPAGK